MTSAEGTEELRDRLAIIAMATEHFVGVNQIEHLLVDLLAFLKSGRVERADASDALIGLIEPWPGAPEVLEFTMRELQWSEVKAALERHVASESDFRTRDLAANVLQVYEDHWPGGEIYRTYRGA